VVRFWHCRDIDAMRFKVARSRSFLLRKYDPNQPRVPAGHPDGGQWTGIPRPRAIEVTTSPEFNALRREVLALIREESEHASMHSASR
jgi:hypothetical protein